MKNGAQPFVVVCSVVGGSCGNGIVLNVLSRAMNKCNVPVECPYWLQRLGNGQR